jgi:malate dehydrogenase (oxaloacetate-decarboxylating)(NADP+)
MSDYLKDAALEYHESPRPGKIATQITKPTENQRDLALAYSPGVGHPCLEIERDAELAYRYTGKGNLVGVITDGTAVLGLGNIGALAGKPVMEGKAVLFKRFADIDVFDIEVNADSTTDFIDTVTRIADTFGGINLEDIKAPECFEIEQALIEKLDIPVFHDDQHGTAIVAAAGLLNALEIAGKRIEDIRIAAIGVGAAGTAILDLLVELGAKRDNILACNRGGVLYKGRPNVDHWREHLCVDTEARTLAGAVVDADVFIGVSGPNALSGDMLRTMAPNPIVFALANPTPEIDPELARATREDVILATGRSDFPNQINNVLCFPYLFRGALDARAASITPEMRAAAVKAIAELARQPVPREVLDAYRLDVLTFGRNYIVPTPFDPRLRELVPRAVYNAAVSCGAARQQRVSV